MKSLKKYYMLLVLIGMVFASTYAVDIGAIAGFVKGKIVPIVAGIAILTGGGMIMLGEDDTAAKGKKILVRAVIGAVIIFAFAEILDLVTK